MSGVWDKASNMYIGSAGGTGLTAAQAIALTQATAAAQDNKLEIIQSGAVKVGDNTKLELKDEAGNVEVTIDMTPYLGKDGTPHFETRTDNTAFTPAPTADGDAYFILYADGSQHMLKQEGGAYVLKSAIAAQTSPVNYHTPATAGQSAFTLPRAPITATTLIVEINGVSHSLLDVPASFTLSGTTVSWSGHNLDAADNINFTYT